VFHLLKAFHNRLRTTITAINCDVILQNAHQLDIIINEVKLYSGTGKHRQLINSHTYATHISDTFRIKVRLDREQLTQEQCMQMCGHDPSLV